jgi:hypothetical protein
MRFHPSRAQTGLLKFRRFQVVANSTVLVRAPKTFQRQTLWPEFLALSEELHAHLEELTDRVIREAIDEDVSEAAEAGPRGVLPESSVASDAQGPSAASPGESGNAERSPT